MNQQDALPKISGSAATEPATIAGDASSRRLPPYSNEPSHLLAAIAAWANSCSQSAAACPRTTRRTTNSRPLDMPPFV